MAVSGNELISGSCCVLRAVQERLTREIAEAILAAINPTGVGVVVEAV